MQHLAKYLKTAGTGGLTVWISDNADVVKFWYSGLTQLNQNVRLDDRVTIHDSITIIGNVAMIGNVTVSGIINGTASAVKSKSTSTHHVKSLDPSNQVWVDSNFVVNPNDMFF